MTAKSNSKTKVGAVELAIFASVVHSIAEEMGATLRRTSFSPNIKERRDYSCAVFDSGGNVIAMGDHMPVHLGSMPMSVRTAIDALELAPGDVAILNDPYGGGTHLPDITMVMPVYLEKGGKSRIKSRKSPMFYVASRAHHADVGGCYPGSMGPCREIYQEGVRIPPVRIMKRGQVLRDVMDLVLYNVRTPAEREGDLTAQIGSCRIGCERLQELVAKHGAARVQSHIGELLNYSERLMRSELKHMPAGEFSAEDFLDNDGVLDRPIAIRVSITIDPHSGSARVDFSGSDPQCAGSVNAVYAITYSAAYYVFRCLLSEDAPATAGVMRPIEVIAPSGTIVNARPPAAVAGGNVETSQRTVDVLMRALAKAAPERVPAASSGTMNNLTIGGMNPPSRGGRPFAYYETTAGGMGARPNANGLSGVHTHMTNSLNTPIEALEYAYPFRVRRYSYRPNSGGAGKYRGGDGIIREIEILTDAQVTILSDRRKRGPYGLAGGDDGKPGKSLLISPSGESEELPEKCSVSAKQGAVVRIESPGGGGWGKGV
jgi:N-methylhydantoinase B